MILDTTPKSTTGNAYVTLARADAILNEQRLHLSTWEESDGNDGEGWLVNGAKSAGETVIDVDSGAGELTEDTKVTFAGHATVYTVTETVYETRTQLKIDPVLTNAVADDEAISRATPNQKERAIIWATRLLDSAFDWFGAKRTLEQRLRFPRSGLLDEDGDNLDYDTYPEILEIATAWMAARLLEKDRTLEPGILGKGLREAKIGSLSVKVDGTQDQDLLPDDVILLLAPIGRPKPGAQSSGGRLVPVYR